jgi:hypothetical protein
MGRIDKRYWKWDERLNDSCFYLGADITTLLNNGIVLPSEEPDTFVTAKKKGISKIKSYEGKISYISYEKPFILIEEGLWDNRMEFVEEKIGIILTPLNSPEKDGNDYLFVAFRDFCVAVVVLFR